MRFAAVWYTAFAALLAYAVGAIESCMQHDRRKAVTPTEVVIRPADGWIDSVDVWTVGENALEMRHETVDL